MVDELRPHIYKEMCAKLIAFERLVQLMNPTNSGGVRFDIRDIVSQHSPYVDVLVGVRFPDWLSLLLSLHKILIFLKSQCT